MIKSAIASSCIGRLRLRHAAFKKQNLNIEIENLEKINGISLVEYNALTGSVLIIYKSKLFSEKDLHMEIKKLFTPYLEKYEAPMKKSCDSNAFSCVLAPVQNIVQEMAVRHGKKKCAEFLVSAMSTTLIPSVALGFMGSKKMHIILGGAFLVFATGHALMYRKRPAQGKEIE